MAGAKGLLGSDVVKRLTELSIEHRGVDIEDFDLLNRMETISYIGEYRPDVVINCAAYTAVDKAEDDRERCYAINVIATRNLAEACKRANSGMVYISTDYVFDGSGETPFEAGERVAPLNYYGYTKELGEREVRSILDKHFIVRTSWIFGPSKGNFVTTMLNLAKKYNEIKVVDDQTGSPTYTVDLARLLCDMVMTDRYGTYHATNEGYCTWFEFAKEIFSQAGLNVKVLPVTTEEFNAKALRPNNSRLSKSALQRAGFELLPTWQDALSRYLKSLEG